MQESWEETEEAARDLASAVLIYHVHLKMGVGTPGIPTLLMGLHNKTQWNLAAQKTNVLCRKSKRPE